MARFGYTQATEQVKGVIESKDDEAVSVPLELKLTLVPVEAAMF